MNIVTLPPAPNWYLSNILSCANDTTVAWGAKSTIVIGKIKEDDILHYELIKNAHCGRITCLAFSPEFGKEDNSLLLSGGDDNLVKIWNLDNMNILLTNSILDVKQKIIGVDWFKSEPATVSYVSAEGCIVYWNTAFNTSKVITVGKLIATSFACCPHESNIVAIGSKNGLVYIVDTRGSGSVLYKMRGHDTEVVSMSWCPIETNIFNNTDARDLLLASGGKDRLIYIWRAGGDGRYHTQITVPSNVLDSQQHKSKLSPAVGNWLTIDWVEPKTLLSSSAWGELISWDLASTTKNKLSCRVIHSNHGRGLFCIAHVPNDLKLKNESWRTKQEIIIWTLAQDRQVICCTIKEAKTALKYIIPTQSGYVYCLAACPLDTSRIAFGAGDAMIRLWNLSESHKTSFDITMIWQKIMGKVRKISWHPEKENLLAFGTEEGRIGVIDVNSKKQPTLFRQYIRNTVYAISWGPIPDKKNFGLYVCGGGELVYYDSEKPDAEPKCLIKNHCTECSWKPDFSYMAVGFEDGTIKFYNSNLADSGKTIHAMNNKAVYCLTWHPQSTLSDLSMSPLQNYLAVAVADPVITVYEILETVPTKMTINNTEEVAASESVEQNKSFYKTITMLHGHSHDVVTLAWSPYISGQLISGSYDHTVQVWKVDTQKILGTYTGHSGPVLCCMWSPLNPDYIISGSIDFTIRIWKLSDQKPILSTTKPPKKTKSNKNKNKKEESIKSEITNCISNSDISKTDEQCSQQADTEIISKLENVLENNYSVKETKKKMSKKDIYFPTQHKLIQNKKTIFTSIRNMLNASKDDKNEDVTKKYEHSPAFFYNREFTLKMIDKEIDEHNTYKRYTVATELEVWRNNLKQNIQKAIKEKRLNDFLVSLTANLSVKTWQETCEAYAMQLISQGDYNKAVTYLLSIHKIHSAIGVFIDAKMYREAYILATCKLDPTDPLLSQILLDWANFSTEQGFFEEAAQCLVKLGDYVKAAKLLSRRTDLASLELAVDLALTSQNEELIESLAEQAVTKSLCDMDISVARAVIQKCPQICYREVQVDICEEIFKNLSSELDPETICKWLKEGLSYSLMELLSKRYESRYSSFHIQLTEKDFSIPLDNVNALWINVSYQLALAITSQVEEMQLKYIVTCLGLIFNFEMTNSNKSEHPYSLLTRLIIILDGKSPNSSSSLFGKENIEIVSSLKAYLCFGIMSWFTYEENVKEYSEFIMEFVKKHLKHIFNRDAIACWTINMKIDKTEAALSLALGEANAAEEEEEEMSESKVQDLSKQLNKLKIEKKELIDRKVCVPNPVVAYSMALGFADELVNEEKKSNFIKTVTNMWQNI